MGKERRQCTAIITLFLACFFMASTVASDTKHAYHADANVPPSDRAEWSTEEKECSSDPEHDVGCERLNVHQGTEIVDDKIPKWDPKGYVMFCPCMGRFGNQGEHYLGALAFAKALDRTLVLPPFRTFAHASFGELFKVEPLQEFHRTIPMEDFMKNLAPSHWPPGKRVGYCHLPEKSEIPCNMKQGNPFGPFWDHFNINFDDCIKYQLHNFADVSDDDAMKKTKRMWDERFPSEEHPVLALRGSPGCYPMMAGNRFIHKYLQWSPTFFAEAGTYIKETFRDEAFVGIHLRNGVDWQRACEFSEGREKYMASPQCLDNTPGATVTKELCLPSVQHILDFTLKVFKKHLAKHLYIATDKDPHTEEFKALLKPLGVSVHYLKPRLAETDLMILGQADYFIGNCVSSFTSFVKRERDANNRPSLFWGQDLDM